MNSKFYHRVVCQCRNLQRISAPCNPALAQRSLSVLVLQTSYLPSSGLHNLPKTTTFLLTKHRSWRGSFQSEVHNGRWEDSSRNSELSLQQTPRELDNDQGRKLEWTVRQTYSTSRRYTSREVEVEEDDNVSEDEADTFGTLSDTIFFKESDTSMSSLDLEVEEDERDWKRERRRKNTPYWYATQMKKMVKEGKLAEAIEFLEDRMLKVDHVQPIEYNYDVLIGACGRAGYTKKAFHLYNRMKERGLHPSNVTYTSLFNACAESPWPMTDGYERLKKLHHQLREKDVKVNLITHHAVIKAYGKCGDIEGAFHLFHNLLSSGVVIIRSFNTILMACASNKEAGFTYALEAWRQMLARGLKPDEFCFNLLLRIVRDCGIGDPETAGKILLKPVLAHPDLQLLSGRGKKKGKGRKGKDQMAGEMGVRESRNNEIDRKNLEEMIQLPPASYKDIDDTINTSESEWRMGEKGSGNSREMHENSLEQSRKLGEDKQQWWQELSKIKENKAVTVQEELIPLDQKWGTERALLQLPNLLNLHADLERVESLASIQSPSDRLSLIGGVDGFIQQMEQYGVKPDVKTLSLFTDVVPMTTEDENQLLALVDELSVTVDVDFYNMIIHRRVKRGDLIKAKEVLSMIHQSGLYPNLRTFANLAIECLNMNDGMQLLEDLESFKTKPNEVVYGALMVAAFRVKNYGYLVRLMLHMKETGVKPNKQIIHLLEDAALFDSRKSVGSKPKSNIQHKVNRFRGFYYKWLSEMDASEEPHPWDAYATEEKRNNSKDETAIQLI